MTAKEVIDSYITNTRLYRHRNKIFTNVYLEQFEADILEITSSNYAYEYEVKLSKADFKNDAKKSCTTANGELLAKHELLQSGERVNYFSFIVPEGMIGIEDVPAWAGLVYFKEKVARNGIRYCTFKHLKPRYLLAKEHFSMDRLTQLFESIYLKYYTLRAKVKELEKEFKYERNPNKEA